MVLKLRVYLIVSLEITFNTNCILEEKLYVDKILKVEKLLLMFPKKVFKVRLTIILENTFNFFF